MEVNIEQNTNKSKNNARYFLYKQALATMASSLISMCSGVTFGITAVMLPQLKEDKNLQYDPALDSWIASISTLSMIIGSLFCGTILDYYGRRAAHIILSIPFIVGWMFISFADSVTLILIGRFITGLSAGANKSVTMVYISEVSDPRIRVTALFFPGIMSHIGMFFSHIVGHYFPWKTSSMICILPAAISSVAFIFLKESPLWLLTKGRTKDGIESFRWFRGTDDASEKELALVCERQSDKPKMDVKDTLKVMCRLSFIKPMVVLMLLMFQTQFSGVNVLSFYSQDIFEQTFSENVNPFTMMLAADCVRAVMSLSICLCAKVSRKIIYLVSSFGVSICLFGLITCLVLDLKELEWIPVAFLIVYICFSSIIVTVAWTFVPEVLPNNVRRLGSGINAAFSYICLFTVVKITPDIMNAYGETSLYGLYAISSLVCGIFAFFVLPETNGKTLQSIEDNYNKNNLDLTYAVKT